MTTKPITTNQLTKLELQLAERDRDVLALLDQLAVVSGDQIRRVLFRGDDNSRHSAQNCRRALLRLTRLGIAARLERRVGGVKSGSDGFCYRVGPTGQRLIRRWNEDDEGRGRVRPEPGERYVTHRLAVGEICVRLTEHCATPGEQARELIQFQAEPDCWRTYAGAGGSRRTLKPDAFTRLGIGDRELWWFIEADLGGVSQRTRADQAAAYRAYWRSGAAGEVMPRVLWCGRNETVAERARLALAAPGGEDDGLFVISTINRVVADAVGEQL